MKGGGGYTWSCQVKKMGKIALGRAEATKKPIVRFSCGLLLFYVFLFFLFRFFFSRVKYPPMGGLIDGWVCDFVAKCWLFLCFFVCAFFFLYSVAHLAVYTSGVTIEEPPGLGLVLMCLRTHRNALLSRGCEVNKGKVYDLGWRQRALDAQ